MRLTTIVRHAQSRTSVWTDSRTMTSLHSRPTNHISRHFAAVSTRQPSRGCRPTSSRRSTTLPVTTITSSADMTMTNSVSACSNVTSVTTESRATRSLPTKPPTLSTNRRARFPTWRTSTRTTLSTSMSVTISIVSPYAPKTSKWAATISLTSRHQSSSIRTAHRRKWCGISSRYP